EVHPLRSDGAQRRGRVEVSADPASRVVEPQEVRVQTGGVRVHLDDHVAVVGGHEVAPRLGHGEQRSTRATALLVCETGRTMHEILLDLPGLAIAIIIALGAASQWVAWRLRVPAILPLLATGFLVGPALGWLKPSELFPDPLLFPVISLAVGLILFEGGLTLRFAQLGEMRRTVFNLVTIGALVTWLGGAAAAYLVRGL